MASDYSNSKEGWGDVVKDGSIDSAWSACGPLITPQELRDLHLMGIPIVSAIKNPYTKKPDEIKDPSLVKMIEQAVALAELEVGIDIFPHQYEERMAYDGPEMDSFGYFRLRHLPAISVEELAVTSSDGVNVWVIPTGWIETGNLHQGQLNIVPFAVAAQTGTTVPVVGPSALGLLPSLFKFPWVPALWRIKYTTGFKQGKIPMVINQLIGTIAAMEVLSMLGATYSRSQSTSLGIDGLSQSQSLPGANIFQPRLKELGEKRRWLAKKLKYLLGTGIIVGNV
jgi:hypothetical protein